MGPEGPGLSRLRDESSSEVTTQGPTDHTSILGWAAERDLFRERDLKVP